MKWLLAACTFVAVLPLSSLTAAHHSLSAEFDQDQSIQVEGRVTKVDWTNPHAAVYIEVRNQNNEGTKVWMVELLKPEKLTAMGWTRDTVTPGMTLRVKGSPALNRAPRLYGSTVTVLATGKTFNVPFVF
jgi:hypothetical protein